MKRPGKSLCAVASFLVLGAYVDVASAAPTKEECLDAHSKGQDQRAEGKLARARQTFFTCSQSSCPQAVQADCARLVDDLDKLVPSLSFAARDARGTDLPATQVFVDERLVATRLDDGTPYEIDPGKHVVRFVHDGKETTVQVVVNQGERGRTIVGTFTTPAPSAGPAVPVAAERPRKGPPVVIAWVATGVLAVGTAVTGGLALSSASSLKAARDTYPGNGSDIDRKATTTAALSATADVLGLLTAGACARAVYWTLTRPESTINVKAAVGPASMALTGTF